MLKVDPAPEASEPSLLGGISQSGGSKQIVIPSSLVNSAEGQLTSEPEVVKLRRPNNRQEQSNKENNVPVTSPQSSSDPPSPVDPNHKPSYLKLSCAVSGYGKYSRYSTYKDVNKRSPYSSQSSLRSDGSSSDPTMPAEQRSGDESTPEHRLRSPATLGVNGHVPKYPLGDTTKDGEYFIQHTKFEEERIQGLCQRAEAHMRSHDLPEEACGRIRAATGKANLLITQKFGQFRDLCQNHMKPDPDERETKWEDLQGFWDMVKIQIDHVDDMFAEIEMMKDNGWQEIPRLASRRSSASSSPKSGSLSQASTPSATPAHTPGSRRKNLKVNGGKDTPDSSPERNQKARQAAKARDEARKKLLAERRAAMKQATATTAASNNGEGGEVEIYLPEPAKK
ncbi:unnamed protein product [Lymnaea stagnalis]|uniref:Uncharacterized protein n=1 Tax=Lymnaea stagnalis TaxID=6523 RepID=A0AAV2HXY9_LYMST